MDSNNSSHSLIEVFDYQRQGKTWEAMKKLKELTRTRPEKALFHKLLGNIYFHMGVLDWAIDYYQQAIELDPEYIDVHYDLGVAYYHRGKVNKAIQAYQTVLQLDPDYHAAHYRIGICYHHIGKLNVAIHHLLESTVITPEYVMAHYHLGVIYYKQSDFEKAEIAFQKVLEENPDDSASLKYLELISKNESEIAQD
jgi:tetratricopeptide (TPR) repeat protein